MFIYNSIPTVVVKDNVVTPEECDYIIKFAEKRGLQENRINVGDEMVKDPSRTSKGTFAKHDEDKVITDVLQRLASIAGVPLSRAEPATIQRYQPGQEYKPHLDAFKPGEVMPDMFKAEEAGNRAVTVILYLNDSDGGSTGFPNLGLVMQAFQGRILMFGNLDENKEAHPLSMHMGLPPNTGDKWILTLWFRERDYILNKSDIRKAVKKMESSDKKQAKKQNKPKPVETQMKDILEGNNRKYHV